VGKGHRPRSQPSLRIVQQSEGFLHIDSTHRTKEPESAYTFPRQAILRGNFETTEAVPGVGAVLVVETTTMSAAWVVAQLEDLGYFVISAATVAALEILAAAGAPRSILLMTDLVSREA